MTIGVPVAGPRFTGTVTNIDLVAPTLSGGEFLLACIDTRDSAAAMASWPAGWTQIDDTYNSTAVAHLVLGYKIAVAGDSGATFRWVNGGTKATEGYIVAFTGVDTTTPLDVASAFLNTGSLTGQVTPTTTTVTNSAMLVEIMAHQDGTGTVTPDAATTELVDTGTGSATGAKIHIAYETQAVAGATTQRTHTLSAAKATRKALVVLRPAASLVNVTKTWNTKWRVLASVTKTWNTKWRVLASVTKTWNTKWNVLASVAKAWNTKWRVAAQVTKLWNTKWNVQASGLVTVIKTWTTKWNVAKALTIWQEKAKPYNHWDVPSTVELDLWQEKEFPKTEWTQQ